MALPLVDNARLPEAGVAVIFTSRRSVEHDEEYSALSADLVALVQQQPGFVRMRSLRDPETREGITVAWFTDAESVRQWKEHAVHATAQQRGVEALYDEYHVTVATIDRAYGWVR